MLRARRLWVTSATSRWPKPASATWSTSRAISAGSTRPCGHHQRNPAALAGPGLAEQLLQVLREAGRRCREGRAGAATVPAAPTTAAVPSDGCGGAEEGAAGEAAARDGVGHGVAFRGGGGDGRWVSDGALVVAREDVVRGRRSWVRATRSRRSARPPAIGTGGAALHQHVAERGGLDRAGDDGQPGAVGEGLAEQGVLAAAAHDVHLPDRPSGQRRRRSAARRRTPPRGSRRSSAPGSARVGGGGDVVLRAPGRDARRHVARRDEARVLDVEDGDRPVTSAAAASRAPRSSRPHARRVSLSSQVPITLVRNRIVPSTPPSLVKLAARAASVSTGASSSSPTRPQVPREMYADVVAGERHADHGRGGVVRPDGHDRQARRAEASPTSGSSGADGGAGVDAGRRRGRGAGRAWRSSSSSHCPGRDGEQPGRGGVGALGATSAPVSQYASRSGTRRTRSASARPGVGGELVERVERQVLQAGARVELCRLRPARAPARGPPRRAARRGSGTARRGARRRGEQAVVDRPRVDADADEAAGAAAAAARSPSRACAVEPRHVPVQPVRPPAPARWRTGRRPSGAGGRGRPRPASPGRSTPRGRRRRR